MARRRRRAPGPIAAAAIAASLAAAASLLSARSGGLPVSFAIPDSGAAGSILAALRSGVRRIGGHAEGGGRAGNILFGAAIGASGAASVALWLHRVSAAGTLRRRAVRDAATSMVFTPVGKMLNTFMGSNHLLDKLDGVEEEEGRRLVVGRSESCPALLDRHSRLARRTRALAEMREDAAEEEERAQGMHRAARLSTQGSERLPPPSASGSEQLWNSQHGGGGAAWAGERQPGPFMLPPEAVARSRSDQQVPLATLPLATRRSRATPPTISADSPRLAELSPGSAFASPCGASSRRSRSYSPNHRGANTPGSAHTPGSGRTARSARAGPAVALPTFEALGKMYDKLVSQREQLRGPSSVNAGLSSAELQEALAMLNNDYHFGLSGNDHHRLQTFLRRTAASTPGRAGGGPGISRSQFVDGTRELAAVLQRVSHKLTVNQLKMVLVAAFERFDRDDDGTICVNEFIEALKWIGVDIDLQDARLLHCFLAPESAGESAEDDREAANASQSFSLKSLSENRSLWEQCDLAVKSSMRQVGKKTGLAGISHCAERVMKALAEPGSLPDKAKRAAGVAWDSVEDLCEGTEFAVDAAGFVVSIECIRGALEEAMREHALATLDPSDVLPFALFLGMTTVNMAKELDNLVLKEMTADEALLYAQLFHKHGFTQAQFRRLLSCPSCKWDTAQPGEVLNGAPLRRLKLVVRGSTKVARADSSARAVKLHAPLSIGETLFLRGRSLWDTESVEALDNVVYVSWDLDLLNKCLSTDEEMELRMSSLLASTMESNLSKVIQVRGSKLKGGVGGEAGRRAPDDAEDESASQQRYWHRRKTQGTPTSFDDLYRKMDFWQRGFICKSDLRTVMTYIHHRLGLGTCEESCSRLCIYLGVDGEGVVSQADFVQRMRSLESCMKQLHEAAMTMPELSKVIQLSSSQADQDGNGSISLDEFQAICRTVGIHVTEEQSSMLFAYFDADSSGNIDTEELMSESASTQVWLSAVQSALFDQAERKGLSKFAYYSEKVGQVLHGGKGSMEKRAQRALDTLWDGIDSLAEVVSSLADFKGVFTALFAIQQQLSSAGSTDPNLVMSESVDLAPFVLFLGISGVQMMRKLAEGHTSDLSELEALLYARTFQKYGFTLTEFQKLLKYARAEWENLAPGQVFTRADKESLKLVVQGRCQTTDKASPVKRLFDSSQFFDQLGPLDSTGDAGPEKADIAVATAASVAVKVDRRSLLEHLQRDEKLAMKVQRAARFSSADRLLEQWYGYEQALGTHLGA